MTQIPSNSEDSRTPDLNIPRISWVFALTNSIILAISLFMIINGIILGQHTSNKTILTINTFSFGVTLLLLQIIHLGLSLQSVLENRSAMLLKFGAYAGDVKPGLVYVFWPFYKLISVTKNMIEKDIPDSPEKIFHGDLTAENSSGVVPEGKVPALRITFAAPEDDKNHPVIVNDPTKRRDPITGKQPTMELNIPKDDAYYKRNTTEIEASFGFCVTNLRLFYEIIGDVDNASNSMKDHAISGLNSRLPKFTLAEALLRLDELGDDMKAELTDYSEHWGICVVFFRFKNPNISHTLNSAVSNVAVEGENLKSTRFKAAGERETLTQRGRGNADANADLLASTAQGLKDIAEVSSTPGGAYAMTVNAAEKALSAAKAVIVPSDNLFGAIAGAAEVLKKIPTNEALPNQPVSSTPPTETVREYGSTGRYGGKKGKDKK